MKPLGTAIPRDKRFHHISVIGDVDRSHSGNVILEVGHLIPVGPSAGSEGWTKTEHVVLTPPEALGLAYLLLSELTDELHDVVQPDLLRIADVIDKINR